MRNLFAVDGLAKNIAFVILAGGKFKTGGLTTSVIKYLGHPAHDCATMLATVLLGLPWSDESKFAKSISKLPMECRDHILSMPEFDSIADQTIDFFKIVRTINDQMK